MARETKQQQIDRLEARCRELSKMHQLALDRALDAERELRVARKGMRAQQCRADRAELDRDIAWGQRDECRRTLERFLPPDQRQRQRQRQRERAPRQRLNELHLSHARR